MSEPKTVRNRQKDINSIRELRDSLRQELDELTEIQTILNKGAPVKVYPMTCECGGAVDESGNCLDCEAGENNWLPVEPDNA